MAQLEAFLHSAVKGIFEDLDIFCRASIKIGRASLHIHERLVAADLRGGAQIGMQQELGEGLAGLLMVPTEAAICFASSMMLLPKERIQEMMSGLELDEEGELTIHEVGNLLSGSLGRIAREQAKYAFDIRLKRVLMWPAAVETTVPFVEESGACYRFVLRTDRSEPFNCALYLPESMLRSLFPQDAFWTVAEEEAAAALGFQPRRGAGGQAGEQAAPAWGGGTSQGLNGRASGPGGGLTGVGAFAEGAGHTSSGGEGGGGGASSGGWSEGAGVRRHSAELSHEGGRTESSPRIMALTSLLSGQEAESKAPSLKGAHVLVVDDSWVARRALAQQLIFHGCVVHDARDVPTAEQVLAERHIDLIMLDLMLPGENGISFCARLRAAGITEHTPVVVVSGVSTPENVVQAIKAGASFFLVKPVGERYLLRVIQGVMQQFHSNSLKSAVAS